MVARDRAGRIRYNRAMATVRVYALPSLLKPENLAGHVVAVFDVLRATTSMAAALSAGATEVQVFGTREDARAARSAASGDAVLPLLAGELDARKPDDFDLGNTPSDFTAERCGGRTILMATTNGTKALVAARSAAVLMTGALANAAATAAAIRGTGLPVTLLCSGTQGEISLEDLVGCGAVIDALGDLTLENDTAHLALAAWQSAKANVSAAFHKTYSAANLGRAGLLADLEFCAVADRFSIACRVTDTAAGLVVRPWTR
ncbi:MAG: phosphosulfolactate phosphohydrolase-like enzyme [Phycisphaerales bacterium]|nr:phosphosulfolactate phosphohydrolase-like enzyme [Phycisphaerales bacterium]